ncbi:hypothetical protein Scep_016370 [Stephania cephalantha]|uniref:Uncharacterized protein n=1 Tax=Stephania cephalantha TaxID=152367 RepID=A0AAP0IPF5_9MAGN
MRAAQFLRKTIEYICFLCASSSALHESRGHLVSPQKESDRIREKRKEERKRRKEREEERER